VVLAELRDLEKTYFLKGIQVPALRGLSLEFHEKEFVAIMGASGSGKSTLLNLLGCLDQPTNGTYVLGGRDVSTLSDDELSTIRNERIGFVFQSFNLIPQLNVVENIEVPLFYRGVARHDRHAQSVKYAQIVGLGDRLHHKPFELSGGQRQRVAIARALVNDPLIILADEPTGALDSRTGQEIMDIFVKLNELGGAIIMVTHEPNIAAYARRTVTLKDGRVIDDSVNARGGEVGAGEAAQ